MGRTGWTLCLAYQAMVVLLSYSNPLRPRGTALSNLAVLILAALSFALFVRTLRRRPGERPSFRPSVVMDVCAFGSAIVFTILGTFARGPQVVTSQPLNRAAVVVESLWVVLVGIIFLIYRIVKSRDIEV